MKKKLLKFFIIIGALAILLILISTTGVQAVTLQANPNTHYKGIYYSDYWITYFRDMEKTGGALGLSETINATTKLATSASNNLDSHMVKSIEYGAAIILSASGYGNPKTLQQSTIKTTTGNETGVYFSGSTYEWVAGGYSGKIFLGVNTRYYDSYTDNISSARVGDALGTSSTTNPGCVAWHGANGGNWVGGSGHPNFSNLMRGGGGVFSYQSYPPSNGYASRGVVVCGEGL